MAASLEIRINTRVTGRGGIARLSKDAKTLKVDLERASLALQNLGAQLVKFGAAASLAFAAPVKFAADFEKSISGVEALLLGSAESAQILEQDVAKLQREALKLGKTTQFTATQSAEAIQFLARAGFETNEILQSLNATLNLAAVEQLDLATAADISSNILTGFGQEAENLGQIVDTLANVSTNSNVNLIQLGEALKTAAPVANSAGVAINEAVAAIGALGNAGLQGTVAGTGLRAIIRSLIKPTGEAAEELTRLGINAIDSSGNFVGLANVIRQFEQNIGTLGGQTEQTAALLRIFGDRGGPAFAALINQGADALEDLTQKAARSGTAAQIAEKQLDNLTGSFTKLTSAAEGFAITIGSPFLRPLKAAVDAITNFIGILDEAFIESGKFGQGIAAAVGVLGGVAVAAGGAAIAIGSFGIAVVSASKLVAVLTVNNAALATSLSVLGKVFLRLSLITAAFTAGFVIGKVILDSIKNIELFGTTVENIFQNIAINLLQLVNNFRANIQILIGTIQDFLGFEGADNFEFAAQLQEENEELERVRLSLAADTAARLENKKSIQGQTSALKNKNSAQEQEQQLTLSQETDRILEQREKERQERIKARADERKRIIALEAELELEKQKTIVENFDEQNNNSLEKLQQFFDSRERIFEINLEKEANAILSNQELTSREREAQLNILNERARRQFAQISQQREEAETRIENRQLEAVETLRQAQVEAIADVQQLELFNLTERQNRELENFRSLPGVSEAQIKELIAIQEEEQTKLINKQKQERQQAEQEVIDFINNAQNNLITDRFQRESLEFEQRQQDELRQLQELLDAQLGISEEVKQKRLQDLREIQEVEKQRFTEQQEQQRRIASLEQSVQTQQIGLELTQGDGFFNSDINEQRNRLELEQLRLQQERKLQILKEFGLKEDEEAMLRTQFLQQQQQLQEQQFVRSTNARLELGQQLFSGLGELGNTFVSLSKGQSKELFAIQKAAAIASATIDVAKAFTASIGQSGFLGIAQGAIAAGIATARLSQIISTSLSFNEGGFTPGTPQSANVDSIPAMLAPNEAIIPAPKVKAFGRGFFGGIIDGSIKPADIKSISNRTPLKVRSGGRFQSGGTPAINAAGGAQQQQQQQPQIFIQNIVDREEQLQTLQSQSGRNVLKNMMRNDPEFRQIIVNGR